MTLLIREFSVFQPAKTTNTVQQTTGNIKLRRQCQGVLNLRGGRCKVCKLLSFLISEAILRVLLLAGTSSEGGGTTRRFQGYLYVSLRFRGVLSQGGWGMLSRFSFSRLIRSTGQVGHFSFVRYFEFLECFYFCKGFCHKTAERYNSF